MAVIILYIVKVGINGLSCSQTVDRARNLVLALTGNPNFVTPFPSTAVITAAADAADDAELLYQKTGSRLDRVARDERWAELRTVINDSAGYVTSVCSGNREKILSSSFGVRALPGPPVPLPAPTDVRADQTLVAGEIKVRWRAVRNRKTYMVQWCIGDPLVEANWATLTLTGKVSHTAIGLDRNQTYCFRIIAVGAAGNSPLSDVAIAQPR